jgi:DNA-binding LacI/PurR family transcriptional regulator
MKVTRKDSIYPQVADELRRGILSGLELGTLPGVQQLAKRFSVNFMTVNKALNVLEAEGLVKRISRKGTFVSKHRLIALAMRNAGLWSNNTIYIQLSALLQAELSKRSCALVYCNLSDDNANHAEMLLPRLDAVVLVGSKNLLPPPLTKLPAVQLLGQVEPDNNMDQFAIDNYRVGELAAEYLASKGCRRAIYLSMFRPPATVAREAAFLKKAAALGMECRSFHDNAESYHTYDAAAGLLEKYENSGYNATGIFASNDQVGTIAVNHFLLKGKLPNRDFYLVDCNNPGQQLLPREFEHASIDLNLSAIVSTGMAHLFEKLSGCDLPVQKQVFEPNLCTAGS